MSRKRDRSKYLFEPDPDISGEEYELSEPQDYDEYLARIESGEASQREHDEFMLRAIQHFVDGVYGEPSDNGSPRRYPELKQWVIEHLADQFMKVIHGGRWEDEFPLPWSQISLPYTRKRWRDMQIFCDVSNSLMEFPTAKVTDLIKSAAEDWNVSYETARAAYYDQREFLKSRSES